MFGLRRGRSVRRRDMWNQRKVRVRRLLQLRGLDSRERQRGGLSVTTYDATYDPADDKLRLRVRVVLMVVRR
jgi:hypothetical protein